MTWLEQAEVEGAAIMKRDFDLIRQLLLFFEEEPTASVSQTSCGYLGIGVLVRDSDRSGPRLDLLILLRRSERKR